MSRSMSFLPWWRLRVTVCDDFRDFISGRQYFSAYKPLRDLFILAVAQAKSVLQSPPPPTRVLSKTSVIIVKRLLVTKTT